MYSEEIKNGVNNNAQFSIAQKACTFRSWNRMVRKNNTITFNLNEI